MFKTVVFSLYVFLIFLFSFVSLLPYFILRPFTGVKYWENFLKEDLKFWSRLIIAGTFSRVDVLGTENIPEGNIVIVSNHESGFDIFIILGYLDKIAGFIAKIELSIVPILNIWIRIIHGIYINRKSMRDSYDTIRKGIKSLMNGNSIIIFPEGKRSRGPAMRPFKGGSFKLATMSGIPILPITIKNSYKMFSEHKDFRSANIVLTIHPAIEVRGLTEDEKRELPERVFKIVNGAL
jgi:1-acyl-sn-glycerol-3-phosphate acyltransferase